LIPWRIASRRALSGPCGTIVDVLPCVSSIAWAVKELLRPLAVHYASLPAHTFAKSGATHGGGNGKGALWKRPHAVEAGGFIKSAKGRRMRH
jgi:hypothetical protein